jgi:hypothetical protein
MASVYEDLIIDTVNLSNELRLVNQNENNYEDLFLSKLSQRFLFSDRCVKAFLELLGGKSVKSRSTNVDKIIEWINCAPKEKRKFYFMKKEDLVNICIMELHGSKTSYISKDRESLMNLLVEPRTLHSIDECTPLSGETYATIPSPSKLLSEVLMKQILSGAFLKPLHGNSRQSIRIGLDNEEPLLIRLIEESKKVNVVIPNENNSKILIEVSEIYRPGMARKNGKDYVKSSIDALGVAIGGTEGDDPQLIGIEVKTRTEETTRQPEICMKSNLHAGNLFVMIKYEE